MLGGRLVWCAGTAESITVPDSASSIGNNAFKDCASLTKVVIPPSVERIGTGTFFGVAVMEIEYKDSMAAWEALLAESKITPTNFPAKITVRCTDGIWKPKPQAPSTGDDPKPDEPDDQDRWQIEDGVLGRYSGTAADVTIPDGVTAIGDGAFAGCTGITHVTIPEGVTSIGESAFEGCTSLAGIDIPASVTDIGAGAFPAGTTVTYHGTAEQWDELAEGGGLDGLTVFILDENGTLTGYRGSAADITLPDGVTAVAGGVFAGHAELEHVTVPEGVTGIGTGAFGGSGITDIEYKGESSAWGEMVEAGGIAGELDGITVTCADGTWTPAHTHDWGETYADGGDGTHYRTCAGCGERSTAKEHTYGGTPQADGDGGHYQTCTAAGCGAQSQTVPHGYTYTDNGDTHTMTCPDCAHTTAEAHDCEYKDNGDDAHTTTCTKCAYSKTEEHRYENGTCVDCKSPQPTTVYVASTGSDDNPGSQVKPFATIQKAVDTVIARNDGTSEYTIYVDGTFTATSSAALADFADLSQPLSVKIAGLSASSKAVLDGNNTARGIVVGSDSATKDVNLTLENLIVQNTKYSGGRGGAITLCCKADNSHLIKNCVIKDNNASYGSAIYNTYGSPDLQGCVISGNMAGTSGTVYNGQESAILTMSDVTIENNSADNGGGVFLANDSTVKISDASVIITGNYFNSASTSLSRGTGICVWNGTLELSGSAKIDDGVGFPNDGSSTNHKIVISGALTATAPVATITLPASAYVAGTQVLTAGTGVTITDGICDKFKLTPASDGAKWEIAPDGTGANGVIAQRTYTFKVESGGTEIVEGSELPQSATITLSEVRRDGVALTESDGTFLIELTDGYYSFASVGFPETSATGLPATISLPPLPPSPIPLLVYIKAEFANGIVIEEGIEVLIMP